MMQTITIPFETYVSLYERSVLLTEMVRLGVIDETTTATIVDTPLFKAKVYDGLSAIGGP